MSKGKILALYSPPDPKHGKWGWFVVTGGVEEGETYEQAVSREILEETGIIIEKSIDLNWGSIYKWGKSLCK